MTTFGSLFAGIGGFDLGLERAGMECRWQIEIDPFCVKVLARHWPEVKRYANIRNVAGTELEPVDLMCGGFPCQDLSQAGKRAGIKGSRSGLWFEFARLIGVLRPRYVLIENVPGLLVPDAMRRVVGELARLGVCGMLAQFTSFRIRSQSSPQAGFRRVADGLPDRFYGAMTHRTKRLGRLGNAVVPEIAEWIGRRILEFEEQRLNEPGA